MQYEGVVITFGTVSDSARLELNGGLEPEGKEHGERTGLRRSALRRCWITLDGRCPLGERIGEAWEAEGVGDE